MDAFFEGAAQRYARCKRKRSFGRIGIATAATLALTACLTVPQALSFLNDADATQNDMSIASNTIEIVERFPEDPAILHPGAIEKTVSIANTGSGPCFVRCAVEFSKSDALEYAKISFDESSWLYDPAQRYYYYANVLEEGAQTAPLFESVSIEDDPENGYEDFEIIVYAESAQATDPSTGLPYESAQAAFDALQQPQKGESDHAR